MLHSLVLLSCHLLLFHTCLQEIVIQNDAKAESLEPILGIGAQASEKVKDKDLASALQGRMIFLSLLYFVEIPFIKMASFKRSLTTIAHKLLICLLAFLAL